jgi:peroxiredoxin
VLTTRQFAAHHREFERRGVEVVRVFRSPAESLRPFAEGPGAVPFPVLADPARAVCRLFGVGGSLRALFSLAARARIREAARTGLKPRERDALRDGIGGIPADFLIGPDGRIVRAHHGRHIADSIPPRLALEWIDAALAAPAGKPSPP